MRLDDFDGRLCIIERNAADAMAALDSLDMTGPEHACSDSGMDRDASHDQQAKLASRLARPLILIMAGTLCLSSAVFACVSFIEFSRFLAPELEKRAERVALNIDRELTRAVGLGIPFEDLVGVDAYLDSMAAGLDEVTHLEILKPRRQDAVSRRTGKGRRPAVLKSRHSCPASPVERTDARGRWPSAIYNYPITR